VNVRGRIKQTACTFSSEMLFKYKVTPKKNTVLLLLVVVVVIFAADSVAGGCGSCDRLPYH
jgi:hypothetical protein